MIIRQEIHDRDIPIFIEKILEKIAVRDSKESCVLIIQRLQVHVFEGIYGLVLEGFIHCAHIIVDSTYLIMLKLEFFL